MKSFFESMEPWRKPEGSLHLYVLPEDTDLDRLEEAQQALAGIDDLPLMPPSYLHFTVQRFPQFDEDVTQEQYTCLGDALEAMCSDLASFHLDVSAPRVDDVSVGCWAARSHDWDRLVEGSRRTLEKVWGGDVPASPGAPHVTLAYAKGPVDGQDVAQRLATTPPLGEVRVQSLHLVSVTVRPERGTFDFTELANWDLGS